MSRCVLVLIGLFALAAAVGCQSNAASTPAPTPASNTLLANDVVTADGIVQPVESAALQFLAGGRVAAVAVKVGDHVVKGEVLARLDDTAQRQQIAQAQAAVDLAQAQLDQVKTGATPDQRAAAQAALDAAQKNYDKVRAGPTVDDMAQLKSQLDNSKALLEQAQAEFDRIGGDSNPDVSTTPQAAQLQQASNNYLAAQAAYDDAAKHPTAAELAAAQAQLDQAKAAVTSLDPTQLALDVAQAQLENAKAALSLAEANAADYTLVAPFDGIVGEKNIDVGDTIVPATSTTPALTVGDVSKLRLETTNLAEVDAPKVQVGENAQVTLNGFPGQFFNGKVAEVSQSAVEYRGDRVFNVWIDLDTGAESGVRWGMSGTAKIAVQ
ncbi:MAG: efflux RND transporter periplasmic adaptor subunit [Chloroflexi bacterium]|nr:efflux RND transporter periplasmic adaptor subunit [Chloroflexota bacterium]